VGGVIDISLDGLRELLDRISQKALEPGDFPLFGAFVSNLIEREEKKIARLRAKLQSQSESDSKTDESQATSAPPCIPPVSPNSPPNSQGFSAEASGKEGDPPKPKPKGHGRTGASAYTNAKHFFHQLALGIIGSLCICGDGRMRRYREKITIRVVGQPLFGVEVHHFEQATCKMCGRVVKAIAPNNILEAGVGSNYIVYDYSACAMLIVMHYFGGVPFKRLESLHAGWEIPLSDSNQWQIVNKADDYLRPLYNALESFGMRMATSLRIDDTGSMVISIMRQINTEIEAARKIGKSAKDIRTGINTTAVYLETPKGTIILFYTGLHHAGEILDQLMKHRKNGPKLVKVTDGASKNFDPENRDLFIEGVCNAHAFLKFRAVKDHHPAEYALAGEVYKQVFDNDDIAKAQGMTPDQRMHFHEKNSKPLMEKLKAMCAGLVENRLVEPNSKLWEPVTFVINQWPRLTKFYEAPGVPLDTNLVEQTLIMPVRYLSASFNYQTGTGAEVGDHHMSLIATAQANDAEPAAYLDYCLKNHEDLAKHPEKYLPWACRDQLRPPGKPPPQLIPQSTAS
jgi:hypothetical protein